MNKHDVFTFTAPNGVEVTAVVIAKIAYEVDYKWATTRFLCYAQNRLFTYEESHCIWEHMHEEPKFKYGEVIVDYAILPDFDEQLRKFTLNEEIMDTFSPEDYNNDDNHDSQQYNS